MSDDEDKLPENLVQIGMLRVERSKKRACTCYNRTFIIDTRNREVTCSQCGIVIDPFAALLDIADRKEQWNGEVGRLLEQRREILNWKPWLLPIRRVEATYRGGQMLPCCPHCGRGILAEELPRHSTNKQIELERRKFERKGGGGNHE